MRHIERINIRGFKSIRETRCVATSDALGLPLSDLNVMIGANGTGRSNFLAFFSFLQAVSDEDPRDSESDKEKARQKRLRLFVHNAGGLDHVFYYRGKATNPIEVEIWFEEDCNPPVTPALSYEFRVVPTIDVNSPLVFEWEACSYEDPNPDSVSPTRFAAGYPTAHALFEDNPASKMVREKFHAMGPLRIYHFADISPGWLAENPSDVNDNRLLRPEGNNIAAFLYFLKMRHHHEYKELVNVVQLVFPFFEDFQLEPSQLNASKINFEWKESGSDPYRDAAYLSDGMMRFIYLATLLLQPRLPGLILIDEPELGLHPYAIGILAELLQAASRKSQVIVSTQSVTLVNRLAPADLIVVERQQQEGSRRFESVFKRLDPKELEVWLDDYRLGDLWEKNVIGGRP